MTQFYTYLHCKPNGEPFYVGKGKGDRAYRLNDKKRNPHHRNIIAKYGKNNIGVYVFPCDSEEQSFADEVQQIAQLRRDGYALVNMTDGGEGVSGSIRSEETNRKYFIGNKFGIGNTNKLGIKESPETCAKKAIALLGNKNHTGKMASPETRALMSERRKGDGNAFFGKKHSPESLKKMSDKRKGKTPWLGRKHTAESIAKMSATQKGKKRKPWSEKRRADHQLKMKLKACALVKSNDL